MSKPAREVLIVYVVVSAATFGITRLRSVPAAAEWVHLLVGALFLLVAVRLAQREEHGMQRYGIDLAGVLGPPEGSNESLITSIGRSIPIALREAGIALAVAAVIFPPFTVGFWWWHGPDQAFALTIPDDFGSFAAAQLLVIGLPEEAFFRGYVQTRIADASPKTVRLLRVDVSPVALVAQAALFALVHYIVDFSPARLAVFFPGLLFGWLRAWRGGIGACILLHALSNVYADLLMRGWLG